MRTADKLIFLLRLGYTLDKMGKWYKVNRDGVTVLSDPNFTFLINRVYELETGGKL